MQQSSTEQNRIDQLMEKAEQNGFDSLTADEAAELFLCFAASSFEPPINEGLHDPEPLSFFDLSFDELESLGLGEPAAFLISRFSGITKRVMPELSASDSERSKKERTERLRRSIEEAIRHRFIGVKSERVLILLFKENGRICDISFLNDGSAGNVDISVSAIRAAALECSADCVVIAHNHPSGSCFPSPADCETTLHLYRALKESGIRLIDHYIVTRESICSVLAVFDYKDPDAKRVSAALQRYKYATDKKIDRQQ